MAVYPDAVTSRAAEDEGSNVMHTHPITSFTTLSLACTVIFLGCGQEYSLSCNHFKS